MTSNQNTQQNSESVHVTVLLNESIEALNVKTSGTYLDCTLGGGGHTALLLSHPNLPTVFSFDRDDNAIARARTKFPEEPRLKLFHAPFSEATTVVGEQKFDGILADLGLSSDQLDEKRGFSFYDEADLDMRMDRTAGITAAELLQKATEHELTRLLSEGGVRKLQSRYARAIKKALPINTPAALAECILSATPAKLRFEKDRHPATVVFQAIRIAVNNEFDEIRSLLASLPKLAAPGCRVACITFHSGEDKLIAERFRSWSSVDSTPPSWRGARPPTVKPLGKLIRKDAILPSEAEISRNPRSRSAKLRVFEFFGES